MQQNGLAATQDNNRRGILLMMLAVLGLIVNDTLMKLACEELPVGQAIFLRGLILIPVLAAAAWQTGALHHIRVALQPAVALRTFGEVVSTALFTSALARLPIANATAILQLVPILSIAGAALILGEKVGVRRWTAVMVGFASVLLIIRPGLEGFNAWSFVVVLAALFVTLRDLSSRRLPPGTSSVFVSLVAAVGVTLLSLGMACFEDWRPVSGRSATYALCAGFVAAGAYFTIISAMRAGEVAVVSPFRYTIILWAILIQIVVFGSTPDLPTFIGAPVLVATGIYCFLHEGRRRSWARRQISGVPDQSTGPST